MKNKLILESLPFSLLLPPMKATPKSVYSSLIYNFFNCV